MLPAAVREEADAADRVGCRGHAGVAVAALRRAAEVPVDLELVLAVDVSGSMDRDEQALQRRGYVEAFPHPEVAAAVRSGPYGRIAVTYVEWAGPSSQAVTVALDPARGRRRRRGLRRRAGRGAAGAVPRHLDLGGAGLRRAPVRRATASRACAG